MQAAVAQRRPAGAGTESNGAVPEHATTFELCFHSLLDTQRALSFPCDAAGRVDMDTLSDKARDDYLYARTVVGRVFRPPAIRAH